MYVRTADSWIGSYLSERGLRRFPARRWSRGCVAATSRASCSSTPGDPNPDRGTPRLRLGAHSCCIAVPACAFAPVGSPVSWSRRSPSDSAPRRPARSPRRSPIRRPRRRPSPLPRPLRLRRRLRRPPRRRSHLRRRRPRPSPPTFRPPPRRCRRRPPSPRQRRPPPSETPAAPAQEPGAGVRTGADTVAPVTSRSAQRMAAGIGILAAGIPEPPAQVWARPSSRVSTPLRRRAGQLLRRLPERHLVPVRAHPHRHRRQQHARCA